MKFYKKFVIVLSLCALASCSNVKRLSKKEHELRLSNDFNSELALKYLTYSQYKADNYDWRNSSHFAKKGLRASKRKKVAPDKPERYKVKFAIKKVNLDELTDSRNRLNIVLDSDISRDTFSSETAELQFLYDCWLNEEASYIKFGQVSRCKTRFFVLLEFMENNLTRIKEEEIRLAKEQKDLEEKEKVNRPGYHGILFNVYFDFDSYKLNREGNKKIVALLNFLETMEGDYTVKLEGHADRVGKKLYNEILARKRCLTVKNKLIKNGVHHDIIKISSFGESSPQIITKDQIQESLNRRVSIKVLQTNNGFSPIPLPLLNN